MATNYRRYSDTTTERLNIEDLEVGDHLIRLSERYTWTEQEYEVTKVLKTRLVLRPVTGGTELRMIVERSKYSSYRDGEVTTNIEGQAGSFRANASGYLFTMDDELLPILRAEHLAEEDRRNTENTALARVNDYRVSRTIEAAEAAVIALQAFIEANQKEEV